jgi:DNA polymerase-3 subunit beta
MTSFVVTGADLHQAAAWASRVTPAKPSAPVLAGLLLEAGDELTVSGYDFDTRATAVVAATTTEPGRMLLSGRLLAAVAKTVGRDTNVELDDTSGAVTVRAGRAEWTLPALPVADYPALPRLGAPAGVVNAGALRAALGQILPVVDIASTLAMLTGVKIESEGEQLTLVGTDRFRLAATTIDWRPGAPEQQLGALVPAALLDTAVRAASGDSDPVSIHDGHNGFGLATDTHLVTGRQIDADYVNWRRVMPEAGEHRALVDVAALAHAADQAVVAADANPQLLLAFTGDGVEVSAAGSDRRAHAHAAADLHGDPITVKVSAGFLRDAVNLHGCDKVTVHFGATPTRPILVLGDQPGYRHTLTPVRMTEQDRAAA